MAKIVCIFAHTMNKMRYILYIWSVALVLTACGGSGRQPAGDESVAPADSMIDDGATEEGVADTTATVADADERAGAPADTTAAAQDMADADLQGLTPTERRMAEAGMVDVLTLDSSLHVSLMYSRADNFTGRTLYRDLSRAFLHPEAARALVAAQRALRRERPDLSLIVYDAARPMAIQAEMYRVVEGTDQAIYVSNPANGGGLHNYGLAVDLSLCDAATGDTLPMGTVIDYMGPAAHTDAEEALVADGRMSAEALSNRRLLRRVMAAGGYRVLRTEWWHFNLRSRAEARRRYAVIP